MPQRNSIKQVVEYLKYNPGSTENEINLGVWGYKRNEKNMYGFIGSSNKKYADLIRRGLRKGIINRRQALTEKGKRYIYYIPTEILG